MHLAVNKLKIRPISDCMIVIRDQSSSKSFAQKSSQLFTAVLPKRPYKTHTPCIIIIFETRNTGIIMASLNVLVKL